VSYVVAIVGGSGRTGREVTRQLLARGDDVLCIVRDPAKGAELEQLGVEVVRLDLETSSLNDFAGTFVGCDAVVFAAGMGADGSFETVDHLGSKKAVDAAKRAGVQRFVQISALGASAEELPESSIGGNWDAYFEAKRAADAYLRDSGLDYTILEPGELSDDAPTGRISLEPSQLEHTTLPRFDLATTIRAVLDSRGAIGKTWQVCGGGDIIATAIASRSE